MGFPCLGVWCASNRRQYSPQMHRGHGDVVPKFRSTVSVSAAGSMGTDPHHYQGAVAYCGRVCGVGACLEGGDGTLLMQL